MSIMGIAALFITGIIILFIGINKKKKWLIIISTIPLLVVLWQILLLLALTFG